ncbi:MAG: hypothetical protein AMXMBFR7_46400 [Planctomycetota bacterium]
MRRLLLAVFLACAASLAGAENRPPNVDEADVRAAIRDVASPDFEVRETAAKKLSAWGSDAVPQLFAALEQKPDPELVARFGSVKTVYASCVQPVNGLSLSLKADRARVEAGALFEVTLVLRNETDQPLAVFLGMEARLPHPHRKMLRAVRWPLGRGPELVGAGLPDPVPNRVQPPAPPAPVFVTLAAREERALPAKGTVWFRGSEAAKAAFEAPADTKGAFQFLADAAGRLELQAVLALKQETFAAWKSYAVVKQLAAPVWLGDLRSERLVLEIVQPAAK